MKRCVVGLVLAFGALLISATTASAATWNVWPGHSIQRAIRHASPGDTIIIHRGVYHESVTIRKSHLTIIALHATLKQPAHPRVYFPREKSGIFPASTSASHSSKSGQPIAQVPKSAMY